MEESLIEMLGYNLANIPSDEQKFIEKILLTLDASKFIAKGYDL